jgi:23S rRNA (guanosine2251-2'-O)-methyltransferase
MKPPHGNRPGGSSRPPSDRGPYRGPGGSSSRPSGGSGGGSRGGDSGPREYQKPRPQGAPKGGPRPEQGQRSSGGSFRPREHDAPRAPADAPKGTVWLYGHHAIAAALANPARRLRRLLLTDEAEAAISKHLSPPWAVSPERVDRARLDLLLGRDTVHQGAALLADPLAPPSLQFVLEKPGVIVVLDQVTDPRNVGAIMRSAAAFGAAAVITQDRNAPEETGGLAKAASGALETLPLLRAVNIARTIIALKAANVWCIGLDAAGKPLSGPAFADRRVALVLGAEGEGLRRLTKETCDEIAGLAIAGAVESLNVSAAASVALYELTRR